MKENYTHTHTDAQYINIPVDNGRNKGGDSRDAR